MIKLKDLEFCLNILDIAFGSRSASPTRKAHIIDHILRSWAMPEFKVCITNEEKSLMFTQLVDGLALS